ncbi:MAG: glycosyltransferase [Ignavibacteria bacterium]|nr:glycosyltransferase [Ignavibacteria bacterium]
MKVKVSIITTVYNCEKFIRQSVESILNQTYGDFEYIIVEDGSSDKTPGIVKQLAAIDKRIKLLINERNIGRVKSLNKALENAQGEYVALQDADDFSMPERLEKQIAFLDKNPDYVLVGANIIVIDEFENFISKPERPLKNPDAKFSMLFRCTFANPSIVYRKKITDEHNLRYEDNFIHAEDFRIMSLIARHGKIYNFEEPLVKYRRHSGNNSVMNFDILNQGSVQIVKENLSLMNIDSDEEQVTRIRNLISSRGIRSEHLYEDLSLLLKIMKSFQSENKLGKNREILFILRRMMKWTGRRNVLTKPRYTYLFFSLLSFYAKEKFFKW